MLELREAAVGGLLVGLLLDYVLHLHFAVEVVQGVLLGDVDIFIYSVVVK